MGQEQASASYICAPKFKAKAPPGTGIWTPNNQTPTSSLISLDNIRTSATPPPPRPPGHPIWTPQPSPTSSRKEFRPVRFESPTLTRRYNVSKCNAASTAEPPWSANHINGQSSHSANSLTNLSTPTTIGSGSTNYCDSYPSESSIAGRASSIADKIKTFERSASTSELYSSLSRHQQNRIHPFYRPNEVIYKVKHEYMSEPETDYDCPRKMAQLTRRQVDGIGPVTNDGMPIVLRSEVKEPHQHEWYKRLYQTIHKQKNGARPQFKSNGYHSEPEPNYDSDYSTIKYRTLDRRQLQPASSAADNITSGGNTHENTAFATLPSPIKSGHSAYKNQPGRIEDYVTGYSSVSEKEHKEWWDEVMDIFNGHLEQAKLSPRYTEGNLSRALAKESGYTSDSNLVFRKKEVPQSSSLSPIEQKQAYKNVQSGGEPPLFGFRKPAPEKPKGFMEHFCYPKEQNCIVTATPFPQPFSNSKYKQSSRSWCTPFSKVMPSFISLGQERKPRFLPKNQKPSPPKTPARSENGKPTIPKRHEQCFQRPGNSIPTLKYGTITLRKHNREPIYRSKSAGSVSKVLSCIKTKSELSSTANADKSIKMMRIQHQTRYRPTSPTRSPICGTSQRHTSPSPVAFGRGVSKERTFAEEKKRLESTLPPRYTNFEASTNILRDPSLRSPQEVKAAVRSYVTCSRHLRSKSLPRLRQAPDMPTGSMSTTVRHSMCFPQIKRNDCIKKSDSCVSSPFVEAIRSTSLARTDSTFSIESSPSKCQTKKTNTKLPTTKAIPKTCSTKFGKGNKDASEDKANISIKNGYLSATMEQKTFSSMAVDKSLASYYSTKDVQVSQPKNKYTTSICHSRSLSPKHYCDIGDVIQNRTESSSCIDNIIQYKKGESSQLDTKGTSTKSQHFSPTREVRVPQTSYVSCAETSAHHVPTTYDIARALSPAFNEKTKRKFSPTREVRIPQAPHFDRSSLPSIFRSLTSVTDIARPLSPVIKTAVRNFSPTREIRSSPEVKHHRSRSFGEKSTTSEPKPRFSPTREVKIQHASRQMRSPSRRRIDSHRTQIKPDTTRVIRASSLGSADDRSKYGLYLCGELAHSATSLTHTDRHSPNCRYRDNSERFTDLNNFYNTIERVGQLEKTASLTSFKPVRAEHDSIDFEEWRQVRCHERVEKELNYLLNKLRHDQQTKDFVFSAKDADEIKWRQESDSGLHFKDRSVEDLCYTFERGQIFKKSDYKKKDEERTKSIGVNFLRRNTVADLASSLKHKPLENDTQTDDREPNKFHLSNHLVSTLSKDQISKISKQLNEIYSNNTKVCSAECVITVNRDSKAPENNPANALKVRCHSSISRTDLFEPMKNSTNISHNQNNDNIEKQETDMIQKGHASLTSSPVILNRVTRGAIGAESAKAALVDSLSARKQKDFNNFVIGTPTIELPTDKRQFHFKQGNEKISQKIQFFEERKFEEPPKTIYHAREDSSPDECEVMPIIEKNIKSRSRNKERGRKALSSSLTDLKGIFGEKTSARINFHEHSPPQHPPDGAKEWNHKIDPSQFKFMDISNTCYDFGSLTPHSSLELVDSYYQTRSISPESDSSSYLQRVRTGDVQRITEQFENWDAQSQLKGQPNRKCDFFGFSSLRRVRSDPELKQFTSGSKDTYKARESRQNRSNATWISHKSKGNNCNVHTYTSGLSSPSKDRFMTHIDGITKTAALKETGHDKLVPQDLNLISSSTMESSRNKTTNSLSISSPDISNINKFSQHLFATWIAHRFPNPKQNTFADNNGKQEVKPKSFVRSIRFRSNSASPPRPPKSVHHKISAQLKNCKDAFANQPFNPKIHQPKARYVPDGAETNDWKNTSESTSHCSNSYKVLSASFQESPNRYLETDVNIHFKTPVRQEYRTPLSEDELAFRQAEQMQTLYQEERRRKYLQELQDMHSRRHTDNFTPSQKSPIPLNRYDDFQSDLAPRSPLLTTKAIARALYNFQGQNARELSFKKGDIIYIRRQIDRNWYEGEHNAMIGMLPANYIEIINKDNARPQPKIKPSEGQARAKFNFQAQSGVELSLNKGELVTLTRRVDENWFEGKVANRKGIFPVSYVEVLTDIGSEDIAGKTVINDHSTTNLRPSLDTLRTNINNEFNLITKNGNQPPNGILKEPRNLNKTDILHVDTHVDPITYRALYKYRPQKADEMELLEGDTIHVLEMCSDGWFVGTNQRTGCFGTFPGNYVERI